MAKEWERAGIRERGCRKACVFERQEKGWVLSRRDAFSCDGRGAMSRWH